MSVHYRELVLLGVVFVAIVFFVFKFVAADLPHDFLDVLNKRLKVMREKRRGGVRDNG